MTMFGRPESEGFHMEGSSSYHRPDTEVIPVGDGDEDLELEEIGEDLLEEVTSEDDFDLGEPEYVVPKHVIPKEGPKVDLKSYLDPNDLIVPKVFASKHPTPPIEPEFLPPSEK